MKKGSVLRFFAIWTMIRTLWMAYMIVINVRALTWSSHTTAYPGIGIDSKLLITWSAVPIQMAGVVAALYAGRIAEIGVEMLAVLVYSIVAIGLWRRKEKIRVFAVATCSLEVFILGCYLRFAYSVSNTFPELRPLALTSGLFFLLAYTSIAVYLALPTVRGYFVPRTSSPLQD